MERIAVAAIRLAPVAILGAGILFRFVNLGQAQLFRDEASSWILSSYPAGDLIQHNLGKTYPPLYGLLLRGWMLVFGAGEAALRSPSAIPGLVTLIVAWRWTHQAVGRGAGLMAAAMIAVSTLLLANSREARMYSLETAFATVAWWLCWRLAADPGHFEGRSRWQIGLTAIALAGAVAGEVWTMAFGLPTAALQLLFAIACYFVERRGRRAGGLDAARSPAAAQARGSIPAIVAIAAGAGSLSVWLPWLLTVPLSGQSFWTPQPDLNSLRDTYYGFLGVSGTGISAVAPAVATLLAVAGLVGLAMPHRLGLTGDSSRGDSAGAEPHRAQTRQPAQVLRLRLFGLATVLGTGLTVVIWLYSQHESIYDPRYLGAAAPPLAALIAAGLATVAGLLRGRVVAAVLALAVLGPMTAGAILEVDRLDADVGTDPGRQTAQMLVSMVRSGDVVLTLDARTYFPLDYYLVRAGGGSVAQQQLFVWNPPNEPFYLGTSLIAPDRLIDPAVVSSSGWHAALPALAPGGTIWLVTIANGDATNLGFGPLTSAPLLEQSGATTFITPVEGGVGQIRPLLVSPTVGRAIPGPPTATGPGL